MIADKILEFYDKVHFNGELPKGISMMNPFQENADIRSLCKQFYFKYYSDDQPRTLILGINPGRLGAGATGIPFTDTKRLNDHCAIPYTKFITHEPSSVYVYEMITAYGGPDLFYKNFYINSVCPLGFIKTENHKIVNYNYYDSKILQEAVHDFIVQNIKQQIDISGVTDKCYCFGKGKNYQYLNNLNTKYRFFGKIIPLDHPRYIMQYKSNNMESYITEYLEKLR